MKKNLQYKYDDGVDENGKEKHLHLLDAGDGFKPLTGTSSVEDVLAKVLTWWASGLAVSKLGWIKKVDSRKVSKEEVEKNEIARLDSASLWREKIWTMAPEDYLKLLDEAYKAHSVKLKDTASAGTDLHAELEHWVRAKMGIGPMRADYDVKIKPFTDWAEGSVKKFLWSEAHCFDENLWVGGISDAGAELNDGSLAVIDFKSAKQVYESHFIQAGGYAIQIDQNGLWDKEGKVNKKLDKPIDYLIVVPFGAEKIEPTARQDVANCKKAFADCVSLYRFLGLTKSNN